MVCFGLCPDDIKKCSSEKGRGRPPRSHVALGHMHRLRFKRYIDLNSVMLSIAPHAIITHTYYMHARYRLTDACIQTIMQSRMHRPMWTTCNVVCPPSANLRTHMVPYVSTWILTPTRLMQRLSQEEVRACINKWMLAARHVICVRLCSRQIGPSDLRTYLFIMERRTTR